MPFKDDLARDLFGRSIVEAHAEHICVDCGESVLTWSTTPPIGPDWAFTDEKSYREYKISGLCQQCQDRVFSDPEEEIEDYDDDYLCPTCGAQEGEPHRFMCPDHTEGV